jgi:hypothetical protein
MQALARPGLASLPRRRRKWRAGEITVDPISASDGVKCGITPYRKKGPA